MQIGGLIEIYDGCGGCFDVHDFHGFLCPDCGILYKIDVYHGFDFENVDVYAMSSWIDWGLLHLAARVRHRTVPVALQHHSERDLEAG